MAGFFYSLQSKLGAMRSCNNMFTKFKSDTISDGVKQLNKVWDLIKSALARGPNEKRDYPGNYISS